MRLVAFALSVSLLAGHVMAQTTAVPGQPTQAQYNQGYANGLYGQEMALARGSGVSAAPAMPFGQPETCPPFYGSFSLGTIFRSFGINLPFPFSDKNCVALRQINTLQNVLNLHKSAIERACQVPAMRKAMIKAGEGCLDAQK